MSITKKQILNAKIPEDIYTNDINIIKLEFRELAKKYHPDVCKDKDANVCFEIINTLYKNGIDKINKGIWTEKDVFFINTIDNRKIKIKFLSKKQFELGEFYICKNHIIYIFNNEYEKYFNNTLKMVNKISYKDDKMKTEFQKYMPGIYDSYKTKDDKYVLVLKKEEGTYLLEDVLKQQKGEMSPRHAAWIISRLNNLNCFLQYNEIVLNGFSLDNCFISPKHHTIMIYGGWWYATKVKEKMIGTKKEIFDLMPVKNKSEKLSAYMTDTESIKYIGRQLLNLFTTNKKDIKGEEIPPPIINWLNSSGDDAFKEFDKWNTVLTDSWGKRKFVNLEISDNDIYNN